jgi:hypothetical protein
MAGGVGPVPVAVRRRRARRSRRWTRGPSGRIMARNGARRAGAAPAGGRVMRSIAAVAVVLWSGAAGAQALDGEWMARSQSAQGRIDAQMTVFRDQYALTSTLSTPQGHVYQSFQSGTVTFHAPETLRFVVLDFEPKVFQGVPMTKPPNGNYRVLGYDGRVLDMVDNVCEAGGGGAACRVVYQRIR